MTCNCIQEIEERAPGQKIDVSIFWAKHSNELVARPSIYMIRSDNGRRENRSGKAKVALAAFCPFCGTGYDEPPREQPLPDQQLANGGASS